MRRIRRLSAFKFDKNANIDPSWLQMNENKQHRCSHNEWQDSCISSTLLTFDLTFTFKSYLFRTKFELEYESEMVLAFTNDLNR